MALEQAFVDDCPYGPDALLLDEILEVDAARSYVRCRMPTHALLPLTVSQRVHPVRHPQHVAGGLMVHMTGMIGFVHAYYLLDLRHADGWIGYGAKIHSAKFHNLAKIGPPLELEGWTTQLRKGSLRTFARYSLRFTQEGRLVYEGDQAAMWLKITEDQSAQSLTP
ncbi:MAG: hypothetical protein Q8Q09_17605 [Deltaproteobacteria bacterium]|nr:hypothetical protein [Deltaproteobacteria bacterium]